MSCERNSSYIFCQSFWNVTDVFAMVCRCAYCLLIILRFIFLTFPIKVNKVEKGPKLLAQFLPKTLNVSGCLHTMAKTSVWFQNDWPKTVGGVALTRHPLTTKVLGKN